MAAPTLTDPNFFRTVVLLLAYDEEGALGVVLNRPTDTPVSEIVPTWALLASPPEVLFSGGPVQPNAAICLGHHNDLGLAQQYEGRGDDLLDDSCFGGYSPINSMMGTVDLQREPEEVGIAFAGLRLFTGYSGWGPGQIDDEIEERAWYVLPGTPADILTSAPEGLWERVLKQQGGWLSVLARHPVDPSLN